MRRRMNFDQPYVYLTVNIALKWDKEECYICVTSEDHIL